MSESLQLKIDYHSARAVEELERAERTDHKAERASHFELSRLHLDQAERLLAQQAAASSRGSSAANLLDMDEASREQGFADYGCR